MRRFIQPPALAGLAVVCLGLAACDEPTASRIADENVVSIEADQVIYDMDDYLLADGVRTGRITADTAYVFQDSAVTHMWGVEMVLYHGDGSERARVTSETGTLNQRTEEMVARGDVILLVDGGVRRVESPELHYDPNRDRIWSDSASVYQAAGRRTSGTCFRSDLDFQDLTVCNIRGSAQVPRQDPAGGGGGGEP
jgi:LPS export ABC transporter protein LptC